MAFDAGAVVGRLEMALAGWTASVAKVKADQQSLAGFAMRHSEEIKKVGQTYAIAGAAIVGSLTAIVLSAAKAGVNFDEMASRTGVSTETLSTLKLAADKSGTSIESVASGMKFLANQMVETSAATDKEKTLLGALGISATDANGKLRLMNDVLFDVADRFAGMEDGALKAKLATAIFGKSGMDLIPILNLGSKGLKENEEAAKRLGIEWSGGSSRAAAALADAIEDLKSANTGLGKTIAESLMPTVKEFVEKATSAIVKVREWGEKNPELLRSVTGLAGGFGVAALTGGTLLITIAKLAASVKTLSILATAPILITVGIVGGAAVAKVLEELRTLYEKKHGTYVDDETKAWAKFEMELGGWTDIARAVGYEYQKLNKFSQESRGATEELDAIWQKFGGNSRQALEAIAKGLPGFEKFKDALRNVGGASLEAALGEEELGSKTEELDPATKALRDQLEALLKQLSGNDEATQALKKAQEDYIAFLNSVGIYTHEQQAAKLKDVEKAQKILNERLADGSITQRGYQAANGALNEELRKYGILVDTALGPTRDLSGYIKLLGTADADAMRQAEKLNTILKDLGVKTMDEVARATREVFKEQMLLTAAYKAGSLSPIEFKKAMDELEARLRSMGGYIQTEAPQQVSAYAQAWADMITNIAQGWSRAFIEMFGITKALIGGATKHNQAFYDQCIADINRTYEASKSALDQQLSDLNDYYSTAMKDVEKYYDGLVDQVNKSFDEQMDAARQYYDDLKDTARKFYDIAREQADRAYDANELGFKRAEEDADIRYARKYDREREAIKNSKMTQGQKDAALLALEIAYEDAKLARDRAREDAKLAREKIHEDKLAALEKARDDKLEALALAREAREKQLELEKEARLLALDLAREAREKQLDLEKEARQKALQLELLALAEKHEKDLEAIRAADELDQKNKDEAQLERQNSLWGKVKGIFGKAIEDMLTAWMTGFVTKLLVSITEKILPGIADIGKTGTGVAGTIGKAFEGIGTIIGGIVTTLGTVITTLASAVSTAISTIAVGIGTAIVTLAEAIAAAAIALAAAVPALVAIGIGAAAIYLAFGLAQVVIDAARALVGLSGSGNSDITYWLNLIWINTQNTDNRFIDLNKMTTYNVTRFDRIVDQNDLLSGTISTLNDSVLTIGHWIWDIVNIWGGKVVEKLGGVVSAINGIGGAASGALVMGPSIVRVGENAPRIPEVILPLPELGAFARGMASAGAGASGGAGGRQPVFVFKPIIIDKGSQWMVHYVRDTVQEQFYHNGLHVPVSAIGG